MAGTIVRTGDHPHLVPVVAQWLWEEFWHKGGHTLEHVHDMVAGSIADRGPPQTFVLLVDGEPVGTASFTAADLDERPDLSPWLAGVVVARHARGRGYVRTLITAVENAGRDAGCSTLWLYTTTAERVYLRAGWQVVSRFDRKGKPAALMVRTLGDSAPTK